MTNIMEFIHSMIGEPPEEFLWLEYTFAGLVMMSCLQMLFNLFGDMGRFFGGR